LMFNDNNKDAMVRLMLRLLVGMVRRIVSVVVLGTDCLVLFYASLRSHYSSYRLTKIPP
jgi:hypothetical protein